MQEVNRLNSGRNKAGTPRGGRRAGGGERRRREREKTRKREGWGWERGDEREADASDTANLLAQPVQRST